MKYKKYEINNCDVYFIKTKKFKTITIDTLLINEYDKKDFTKQKLLSSIMLKNTKRYPNEIDFQKEIINLYDLNCSIYNLYLNYHIKTYRLTFLNEKFTEEKMNEKSINFYYDFIFKPNIIKNSFEKDSFKMSKIKLKTFFKRLKEDNTYLAESSAFPLITYDIPLKYNKTGNIEDLKKITPSNLVDFYKNEIKNSDFKVFVIGDFNDKEMIDILSKNLTMNNNKNKYKIKDYKVLNRTEEKIEKIEENNYNQSIFIMIFKILNITKREREIVLPIFSEILGGSDSKLFNNVREKNSLAYYIYSSILTFQSTLIIESGISSENYEKVKKIVLEQIKEMCSGNITEKELKSAKERIKTNALKVEDNKNRIINSVEDEVIFGLKNNEDYIKETLLVSKKELIKLGKKLDLDVTYLLKGVK